MGIPDHLACLLRNLYEDQEVTVRTRHGTIDWFQIGKGVRQSYILSLCLFNLYEAYIMQNARLHEAQAGIKSSRKNTITSDIKIHYLIGRKLRGTKVLLDEVREESGNSWFKTQHSKK